MIKPSTAYVIPFETTAAGLPVAADATPTAVLWRNGSAEPTAVVIVTTANTGIYHATFTTDAGWATTDRIWLIVSATIGGDAFTGIVWDSFSESDSKAAINVLPATGISAERSSGVILSPFVGETISQSITLYEIDGTTPIDLSGKSLEAVFESRSGGDVSVISNASIVVSGDDDNIVTFAYPSAVTASERLLRFSLRDDAAPRTVYLSGLCRVSLAPGVDP